MNRGRPKSLLTHRRIDVLVYLVSARLRGEPVSLSSIQRSCCLTDRAFASRLVHSLMDAGIIYNTPTGKYLPKGDVATWTGGDIDTHNETTDVPCSAGLGPEGKARRQVRLSSRRTAIKLPKAA